jgi:hypothetical protein
MEHLYIGALGETEAQRNIESMAAEMRGLATGASRRRALIILR